MSSKILLVYSGGLDSTVLLADLLHKGHEVGIVNFYYGSKHNAAERASARDICNRFNIAEDKRWFFNLTPIMENFDSALLANSDEKIPEGHYAAENMKRTVVPFRNGIMLSIAAGLAESKGYTAVAIAAHAGDHYIYPDCRPEFLQHMESAMHAGTEKGVVLFAPFSHCTKTDIARIGAQLRAPMHLSYSCYNGGELHCGKCGACTERKEAFRDSGTQDFTKYADINEEE